jgi:hypothetical protein
MLVVAAALITGMGNASAHSGVEVKEPQYGFSFALPASWKQVPLNGTDVTSLLNAATHDDPSLTNGLSSEVESAASKGVKVFAIGPVSGLSVPNVNVIVGTNTGGLTGRSFAQSQAAEAKIEFTEIGATHIKESIVRYRAGTAAQLTYELGVEGSEVIGTQVYLEHNSHIEIVTVSTPTAADSQSNMRLIMDSWRWT